MSDNEYPLDDRLPKEPTKPFEFMSMDDLAREEKLPDWLIKDVIECGTHGMLFGDPESGKTLVLFDLLYCVASGRRWRNRKVTQGPVFYLCGEGAGGLGRRARAWRIENDIDPDASYHFYTSKTPAALLDKSSAIAVCDAIRRMCDEIKRTPAVIGIDTLARNFGGGDENSAKDIGQFIAHIDECLIAELGCAVITSHHTGHGSKDRARGSMSLPGALDVFYQIVKQEESIVMTCMKSKDFKKLDTIAMKMQIHGLGFFDDEDREVTGATVHHDPEYKVTIKPAATMSKPQQFCYEILCQQYEDTKARKIAAGKGHELVLLELEEWRKVCTARRAGSAWGPGSQQWNNARKYVDKPTRELIANGVVKHRPEGPFIHPAGTE